MSALDRWAEAIDAWRLPARFRGPEQRPRRPATVAEKAPQAPPGSRSYARETEALPAGGSVLDVGCGAGGGSLPLAGRAGLITGVDPAEHLLAALRESGTRLGVRVETITGTWPDAAARVAAADVVVCHHVLFGVAELAPFVAALTAHARHRVVIEIPERHPLHALNPLWNRFHGLRRPAGPTAEDAAEALAELGVNPGMDRWRDDGDWGYYPDLTSLAERTRRRLALPAERLPEVAEALRDLGVDPDRPRFPGIADRPLYTLWWDVAPRRY